jgi:hypothetical protein
MAARIELVLDALVLRGFATTDVRAIGEALESELARLLSGQDLSRLDGNIAMTNVSLPLPREAPPADIGAALAGAIHDAIGSSDHA